MMKKRIALPLLLATVVATSSAMAFGDREGKECHHGGKRGFGHGEMNHEEMMNRKFNEEEIRTLVSARLLMRGNDNLKLGKVTPTATGYTATVVTKKENSVVEELQLAPNGMPLEMFQKMSERMKAQPAK